MMKMSYLWDPSDVFKNVLLSQKRECEIHFMPRTRELAAEEMKISRVTIELLIVPCDGLNRVVARICSVTICPTINSHGLIGLNGSINNAHPGKRDCSWNQWFTLASSNIPETRKPHARFPQSSLSQWHRLTHTPRVNFTTSKLLADITIYPISRCRRDTVSSKAWLETVAHDRLSRNFSDSPRWSPIASPSCKYPCEDWVSLVADLGSWAPGKRKRTKPFFFRIEGNDYEVTLAEVTNPHVIVQSVHVRRIFNRMQRNSTVNLFFLQVSGERLRPGTVVIQDRLHLQKRKHYPVNAPTKF